MPITPTSSISKNYQALGIDEIANDIETAFTAINALETTVNALPTAPTTTVVNISSAQILAMGSTPIELLPAAGVGMYYDWEGILEYTHGTTGYTSANDLKIQTVTGFDIMIVSKDVINFGENCQIKIRQSDGDIGVGAAYPTDINSKIEITCVGATNPTLGDGTLRAIITYTTRTFGA